MTLLAPEWDRGSTFKEMTMTMKLSDLIDQLQDLLDQQPDGVDPDVMIATQPSYPLAFKVGNVTVISPADDQDLDSPDDDADPVVWIATGDHPRPDPYAPRAAWSN